MGADGQRRTPLRGGRVWEKPQQMVEQDKAQMFPQHVFSDFDPQVGKQGCLPQSYSSHLFFLFVLCEIDFSILYLSNKSDYSIKIFVDFHLLIPTMSFSSRFVVQQCYYLNQILAVCRPERRSVLEHQETTPTTASGLLWTMLSLFPPILDTVFVKICCQEPPNQCPMLLCPCPHPIHQRNHQGDRQRCPRSLKLSDQQGDPQASKFQQRLHIVRLIKRWNTRTVNGRVIDSTILGV